MQPIRGKGRGRVDRRGRGRDGGRGCGQDGEGGRGTPESTLPTSTPPILTHHPILPYFSRLTHHVKLVKKLNLNFSEKGQNSDLLK